MPLTVTEPRATELAVHGYCNADEASLLSLYENSGPAALTLLAGNYVIVIQQTGRTTLVSSAHGAWNYFYAEQNGQLFHGDTILQILRQSRLPWKWNWQALADVSLSDHPLENDTLHPDIHRLPAACVLTFEAGKLTLTEQSWESLHPNGNATADAALAVLNAEIEQQLHEPLVLSMSGGFDTRVLLSSLLLRGVKPHLLTLGYENTTDAVIADEIAKYIGLPCQRVALEGEDLLEFGPRISEITNGCKPSFHWHAYVYSKKAGLAPGARHFVGSNGEFARSFLLDKGLLCALGDWFPGNAALVRFWGMKFNSPFMDSELEALNPEFAGLVGERGRRAFVERRVRLSPGGLTRGLDHFYLRQRVRQFIANGIKLYADSALPITPMLHLAWTKLAWNLPRRWKQGNNWHRYAVQHNRPDLMRFAVEKDGQPMAGKAPPLYWSPLYKKKKRVTYERYDDWFSHGQVYDFIHSHVQLLADVIEPKAALALCERNQQDRNRTRAMGLFLMLIHWQQQLKALAVERPFNVPANHRGSA